MRCLGLVLTILLATFAWSLEPNLLTNGGLEKDADGDGVADGWFAEVHRHEGGEGFFALDTNIKVQGKFSQRIVHTSDKGWVRISQDGIPAKPNSRYLFRCWVKADCRFLLIVYAFKVDGSYDTFVVAEGRGTRDAGHESEWRLLSGIVGTPADARSFKVSLITDGKGTAWFDGVELILLERPPYIFVPTVIAIPKLDGDLSDDCWREAEPLTPFLELGTNKIAEPATVAKVVATQTHLFVAFHCNEPNPKAMRLQTPESGEPAYTDDCVEVYLDPQHTHSGFWQFVLTPKGNKWAQQVEPSRWARVWWLLPRPTQRIVPDGWQAKAKIGDNFWAAEIAIPFELLGFKPHAGQVIGINLCRSRKAGLRVEGEGREQNSAFAYLAERSFQHPERFPHATLMGVGLGEMDGKIVKSVRWRALGEVALSAKLSRPKPSVPDNFSKLVPKPQRIFVRNGQVSLTRNIAVVLPDGATELERTAAELLVDTLKNLWLQAAILNRLNATDRSTIVLTTFDRLPAELRINLPVDKLRTFFKQRGEEAYAIFVGVRDGGRGTRKTASFTLVSEPCIVVIGSTSHGVFNGVQTLRQLLFFCWDTGQGTRDKGEKLKLPVPRPSLLVPSVEIWDYPDLKLRGWHFVAPLRHELPFAEKLLEWFALMKFNTLVVEVDDRFPYERHPDIAHPQAMTKEEWLKFLAKARKLGFEVIPQVQTFGHFGYVLEKPKYRHLSELKEPHPRWGFYAYCPSNPETYKVVFDLFDEVIEVFKPRWFHIGHDEITFVPTGVCERCKATGKTAWQLLAEDIRKLHDYLKAKGIERVAMWCDQLEPDRTGGYAPFFTHFAVDLIPKEIVQFCWHYDARQTFPWLTRLKDKGFDVVACGWYHAQNVWRFAAESFDRRALGYCGTTWYGVTGFANAVDLMTAVVLGTQNSWSVDNPPIDKAPHPTNIAQDLWALVGERGRWGESLTEFACLDLSPFVNASLTRWGNEGVVQDRCVELEQTGNEIWCEGIPFRLVKVPNAPPQVVALSSDTTSHEVAPDLVAVPVGSKAKAIYLLLTTTARPTRTEDLYQRGRLDPRKVATLLVRYADGTEERVELIFRRHLTEWNDRLGCSHARVVWQGKTEQGYLLTLCAYEWRNPKPGVPIAFIALMSAGSSVQPVLVALTIGE